MQGESRITNSVLRLIGKQRVSEIDLYVTELLNRSFSDFSNSDEIDLIINDFIDSLSEEDLLVLRSYTGYSFKNVNAILRNNWNYEEHGLLNMEIRLKYLELIVKINDIISKFPALGIDFCAYRGVDLSAFKKFGISRLEELVYLKGKYMYEEGFTSTSVKKECCYFNKNLEDGKTYNVRIKYFIPRDSADGVLLTNYNLSYSSSQQEYLLRSGSLVKVLDVSIDLDMNLAELVVVVIPKKVWNLENTRNVPAR